MKSGHSLQKTDNYFKSLRGYFKKQLDDGGKAAFTDASWYRSLYEAFLWFLSHLRWILWLHYYFQLLIISLKSVILDMADFLDPLLDIYKSTCSTQRNTAKIQCFPYSFFVYIWQFYSPYYVLANPKTQANNIPWKRSINDFFKMDIRLRL